MPTVTVGSPVFCGNKPLPDPPKAPPQPSESPSPTLPKGREFLANALDTAGKSPRPLGRVGEGLRVGWDVAIGRCASPATIIGGS